MILSCKKCLTPRGLEEHEDKDLDLIDDEDNNGAIDIVELPPERAFFIWEIKIKILFQTISMFFRDSWSKV